MNTMIADNVYTMFATNSTIPFIYGIYLFIVYSSAN